MPDCYLPIELNPHPFVIGSDCHEEPHEWVATGRAIAKYQKNWKPKLQRFTAAIKSIPDSAMSFIAPSR